MVTTVNLNDPESSLGLGRDDLVVGHVALQATTQYHLDDIIEVLLDGMILVPEDALACAPPVELDIYDQSDGHVTEATASSAAWSRRRSDGFTWLSPTARRNSALF